MNIAYIMRGIPGSGKSTCAKELAGNSGIIHSTDDYSYVSGEFRFDASKLSEYHDRNFEAFCQSLEKKIPIVICDNTNIKLAHFERYIAAAAKAGYSVVIVEMPMLKAEVAAKRSAHKVPVSTIQRMIKEWNS